MSGSANRIAAYGARVIGRRLSGRMRRSEQVRAAATSLFEWGTLSRKLGMANESMRGLCAMEHALNIAASA
jgi:hypothetical protein